MTNTTTISDLIGVTIVPDHKAKINTGIRYEVRLARRNNGRQTKVDVPRGATPERLAAEWLKTQGVIVSVWRYVEATDAYLALEVHPS